MMANKSTTTAGQGLQVEVFSFGDSESVLDGRGFWGYAPVYENGRYYEPPIDPRTLAKMMTITCHHSSALRAKWKMLCRDFVPTKYLSRGEFLKFALDFIVAGNGYLEQITNRLGGLFSLQHCPTLYSRVGKNPGQFFFIDRKLQVIEFSNKVLHLKEYDLEQEIYGVPEYLAALQPALLNESATIFRRRYYKNGAHAGFILYATDSMADKDWENLKTTFKQAKGDGNFKNLFLKNPSGTPEGIKLIPISEVAAKDEFLGIKSVSAKDVMVAHRVPPQILGVVPENNGGFGNAQDATNIFFYNEIIPLQNSILDLNDELGFEAFKFKEFVPFTSTPAK